MRTRVTFHTFLIYQIILFFISISARAYETHVFEVWKDSSKFGKLIVRFAYDKKKGDTYFSEALYVKKKVPTGPKGVLKEKTVSIRRAWGVYHRGMRLGQYRRWIPGDGGMLMYMLFRYGRRIKQRVASVLGGSAKVRVATTDRRVKVVDPYGIVQGILLVRAKLKDFKCINPVSGNTGDAHVVSYKKDVNFPLRGELSVQVKEITGSCGRLFLYYSHHRLIGGEIEGFFVEVPCKKCRTSGTEQKSQ